MFRQALARNTRLFSTSVRVQKGPVETATDAIKTVDKNVSQTLVKGIEKGEEASAKVKEAAGLGAQQAKEKAGEAAQQAHDAKEQAKGAAKS